MEVGWFSAAFEVLDVRMREKGVAQVVTGGWKLAEMPEAQASDPNRGKRPFMIIDPVRAANFKFTNRTKYADLTMAFVVEADTFEELDERIAPKLTAALQHPAGLSIGDGTLKVTNIRPEMIEYEKIENVWTGTLTFTVQANQPAAASVA